MRKRLGENLGYSTSLTWNGRAFAGSAYRTEEALKSRGYVSQYRLFLQRLREAREDAELTQFEVSGPEVIASSILHFKVW